MDDDFSDRSDSHASTFKWTAARHRGITSHADADAPTFSPRFRLFQRKILVADQVERAVETSAVVTAVVDHLGFVEIGKPGVIRKVVGLEQIATPYLNRIEVQALSGAVHHAFHD